MGMASNNNNTGNGLYKPVADINVTPLVDVMLVLLIIFMVTAPLLANGMKVELPKASSAQPLNPQEPVVITVAKDGKLALGPDEVEASRLIDAIREKIGDDATRTIHVRGDKEAAYGGIVAVLDLLSSNGLTHIAIVSDNKTREPVSPTTAAPK
jgi:biopolymer transport protein ExbD